MKTFLSLALLGLCAASPLEKRGIENTPEPSQSIKATSQEDINLALKLHNDARAEKGFPPLRWDSTLAAHAQTWAQYIADQGSLIHSTWEQRDPEGENLFKGYNYQGYAEASWYYTTKEKPYYHGQVVPADPTQNDFEKWGHYSQVMSKNVTAVGMGWVQKGAQGEVWIASRYDFEGNTIGEAPF